MKGCEAPKLVSVYQAALESDVLHVVELLKDYGIYSEIKNEGIGSYLQIYGGVNYLGTNVCVSEADAEAASSIIKNFWRVPGPDAQVEVDSDVTFDEDEPSMEAYRRQYNKSLRFKKNMLKVFVVLIFGTGLLYQLLAILF